MSEEEYTRDEFGEINIVIGKYERGSFGEICVQLGNFHTRKFEGEAWTRELKISKNITDLIEDKDIVEIQYYSKRRGRRVTRIFEVKKIGKQLVFLNHRCSFIYDLSENKWIDGKGFNPKIKAILTKEQYEANCYRLEEK